MDKKKKLEGVFTSVYQENRWGDNSSVSGPGSSLEQTSIIREKLLDLIRNYKIRSITDAPCGDFFWMKEVLKNETCNIDSYTGIDIVEDLIMKNQRKYGSDKIGFIHADLTRDIVPKADLIICRDCFLHLSYRNIYNILNNFKLSGADYILASSYNRHKNSNVYKFSVEGMAINLEVFPFMIKNRLVSINEDYHGQNEMYNDKSLNFIRVDSLDLKGISRRIVFNEIFFIPAYLLVNPVKSIIRKIIRLIRRIL
jgi:hypothetical protein